MGPSTEPLTERFPKACRVLKRREFLRIQGQGHRIHGRRLIFQFLPGSGAQCRLGITVSKKVGNSPVRSQIKRWIRESFRRHTELRPTRGTGPVFDLVITAKRDVEDFSWAAIDAEIVHALHKYLANPLKPHRGRGGPRDNREAKGRDQRPVVPQPEAGAPDE